MKRVVSTGLIAVALLCFSNSTSYKVGGQRTVSKEQGLALVGAEKDSFLVTLVAFLVLSVAGL